MASNPFKLGGFMKRFLSLIITALIIAAGSIQAGNEWITTGKSPEYPVDLYFVGVGLSEKGQDAAKQSAMVEIKKQISVKVNSSTLDEMSSFSINGSEKTTSKSESRAMLTTEGDVQGIQVVATAMQGKIYYALAVLDKNNFISNTKAKIQEMKKDLSTQITGAKADIAGGKIGLGMKKLSAAKKDITDIYEQRTLLSAAAPVTEAESVPVSQNDIAALYEQCVASIKVEKTGGDNQGLSVGMVPEAPFAIMVTAQGTPVTGVLVELRDENNKLVMDKFTDETGSSVFSLGENVNSSVGTHKYATVVKLPVNSNLQKTLASTNQTFSYTVKSNPCYSKVEVKVQADLNASSADLIDRALKLLAKYDVMEDKESENIVQIGIAAKETGTVSGLSESNTFVKTDVTLSFALVQDNKNIVSFQKIAKGQGSTYAKSVADGLVECGHKERHQTNTG